MVNFNYYIAYLTYIFKIYLLKNNKTKTNCFLCSFKFYFRLFLIYFLWGKGLKSLLF